MTNLNSTDTNNTTATKYHETSNHTDTDTMIKPDPARTAVLLANLQHVKQRISAVVSSSSSSSQSQPSPPARVVRLVAVSKLKPASDILALHSAPVHHLHFGENYVQELLEKARVLPKTIKWHFIGGLQSNKARELAREVEGLWAVESVDSVKKATLLDKGRGERAERSEGDKTTSSPTAGAALDSDEPLRVFIQVNTSGEESKSGVAPLTTTDTEGDAAEKSEIVTLAKHIIRSCPHLRLQGLMTIGAIARSKATTPETENEDFLCLRDTRDRLVQILRKDKELEGKLDETYKLELSMGMSEDFEGAVKLGSDEVRVGSTIFGERPQKKDAKVL
ncbi:Pyridoxal phosphate homeostasis protein [Exophiala dermatitidis]